MSTPREILQKTFSLSHFRPGQQEVIEHLLAGRSAAAVFPTGGGKSLCYQLPALMLPGVTLVVSPLIALMKEQLDRLLGLGIPAARLDSTLTVHEYRQVMSDLRSGKLRMLYLAPERFGNERVREVLLQTRVALFAVDEAHCISEWGHNFRPDYLKLARFARDCRAERILALTATATPQVLEDVCRGFAIAPECAVRTGFHRPNLNLRTTSTSAAARDDLVRQRLRERPPGPTIIYVTLQRTAEEVAARLAGDGFPARAYHAGMEDDDRARVQDEFAASDRAIVVATIAFGMGIDKANIRAVFHYNLPKSLENYSQEVGRAGRDGQPADCEMLVCPDDLNQLENFVYGDTPALTNVEQMVNTVLGGADQLQLNTYELSQQTDIRLLVLSTLLTYLELDGWLEGGTPYYSAYKFQPLVSSAEILTHFEGERRQFLQKLLATSRRAQTWFHIDLENASRATGTPRERVVRALDYLAERGWMTLEASGVRHRYRRLKRPTDTAALAQDLHRRTLEREAREIARLHQVMYFVSLTSCQADYLCQHFGERLAAKCGHCSWCREGKATRPGARRPGIVDAKTWEDARTVRRNLPDLLDEPRAFARFLCGLTSPRISRAKLSGHRLFGVFAEVPFPEILRRAES